MKRSKMIQTVKDETGPWDVIIIGGGATGLGAAVDASSRGYKTLLLEMADFAKGTSSRSTKLIHGGVRYLEQGNISLVMESLRERGILMQNAPHLVRNQPFIVPFYKWWEGWYYWLGLRIYDILAGDLGLGPSKYLNSARAKSKLPTIESSGLHGGVIYYDGQFDDSRLAINLAKTCADEGGTLINYMKVVGLLKSSDQVTGVKAKDMLSGEEHEIEGKVVINATGVFTDTVMQLDNPGHSSIITPSQGVHIVIDRKFMPGDIGMMIPKTSDGRILFALPWHNRVMLGTTDTPVENISEEPEAMDKEIDFILSHAAEYLTEKPALSDIRSVFAGLRPLVTNGSSENTSEISRDHSIIVTESNMITITGGKWTTYRKMAEEVIDKASEIAELPQSDCITENLRVYGWTEEPNVQDPLGFYGSDKENLKKIIDEKPELGEILHERLPYLKAEVVWATRNEMAMTVEDFNSRRTRALFLDAKASEEMAPEVARLMASEAGFNDEWIQNQVDEYTKLARRYQVN